MQVSGRRIFFNALAFLGTNLGGIVLAGLIPGAILIAAQIYGQHLQTEEMIRVATAARSGQATEPHLIIPFLILFFPAIVAGVWLFVRVTRFRLQRDFEMASDELSATLWSLLYWIALTLLIVVPTMLIALLASFAIAAITGGTDMQGQSYFDNPAAAILTIILATILVVAFFYISVRFWIGVPGVALGQKPSIFKTIWPLGRSVAWSLVGWTLVFSLIAGAIFAAADFLLIPDSSFESQSPMEMLRMIAETPDDFRHVQFVTAVLSAAWGYPVSLITSTIFAEAYAQLTKALTTA